MISAVVLAAGLSSRMGHPKMVLPWGETTVIGRVVEVLAEAGVGETLVVTGGGAEQVKNVLHGLPVRTIDNPKHAEKDMVYSLQLGLQQASLGSEAALVVLGDQPQIQLETVLAVLKAHSKDEASLVIPSYRMHRGHPWLVGRSLWPFIQEIQPPDTLRTFLDHFQRNIRYIEVCDDSILRDLDTPTDYARDKPVNSGN
jgi:molybdenum cofactor cytidylyltransferase